MIQVKGSNIKPYELTIICARCGKPYTYTCTNRIKRKFCPDCVIGYGAEKKKAALQKPPSRKVINGIYKM